LGLCARLREGLRQQRQASLAAHGVHPGFVFDRMWHHALFAVAQLRAVTLRPAFQHADAVVDERELPAGRVAILGGPVHQVAALTHEIRLRVRMQGDAPGGARAFHAHQRMAGPAEHRNDLP
jgi:hypothetical protein